MQAAESGYLPNVTYLLYLSIRPITVIIPTPLQTRRRFIVLTAPRGIGLDWSILYAVLFDCGIIPMYVKPNIPQTLSRILSHMCHVQYFISALFYDSVL